MDKFFITPAGINKLTEELNLLKKIERPAVSKLIASARELGDLSENAEYHAAREKQSFIEAKIAELEDKAARAEVIDISNLSSKNVIFGANVTIVDEETDEEKKFQIVGEYEADLNQGMISLNSPIARALIGKTIGDVVEVHTPKGFKNYEIISIEFDEN